MKNDNLGFGMEKIERAFDCYKKKYVTCYTQNHTFSGRVIDLNDQFAILKPYLGYQYDKEKGAIRALINKPAKVRLMDIISVEPITRKDLEGYCEFTNSQSNLMNGKKDVGSK